jgi:predicted oxidoreductase
MVTQIQIAPEGPTFSRIVGGFWRLDAWGLTVQERLGLIEAYLDLGVTTFDHADIYGGYTCEELFGEVLALQPALRDRMQFVTKCGIKLVSDRFPHHKIGHYDTGKDHILASADRSLRALGTDRIDLLLIHRPDPLLDADEVAEAFTALRRAGKVLHFGVSNFTPFQLDLLAARLPFPLVSNQVECSVMAFDVMHDGTLDQCQRLRIAPMAWSPFGGGRLFTDDDDQARRVRDCLKAIGEEVCGASPDQVALAWLLRHPSRMLPVLGTGKLSRIKSALGAESVALSRQQWFQIWRASKGHDVP